MKNVLGVVFSNMHEHMLTDLIAHRCMGAIPIGGRYRLIDFILSSFANSGIEDVGVITKTNYQGLINHLSNGREWDLSRKNGGLCVLPPYGNADSGMYRGRIEALYGIMNFLKASNARHVITADCNMLINATFDDMLSFHMARGADITVMYKNMELPEGAEKDVCVLHAGPDGEVQDFLMEPHVSGMRNIYLNIMVISKKLLEYLVNDCHSRNMFSFEKDVLQAGVNQYKISAYEYKGFVSRCSSLQNYYDANLSLLDGQVRNQLFPREFPIYTKVLDDAPVRYGLSARVRNTLLADGCLIEGDVEDSILFRGVTVGKGVKIKNSVIMQGVTVGNNSRLDCVVADKDVLIRDGRNISGCGTYPVYISKGSVV